MTRSQQREELFKLIFEFVSNGTTNTLSLEEFLLAEPNCDVDYINNMYNGITSQYELLKKIIDKVSHSFTVDRMYRTDLAILVLATYELLFAEDVPYKVSINEAVELSKKYSTEKSSSYVNGILGTIYSNRQEYIDECKGN